MGEQTRERALELPSLKGAAWLEREETRAVFDALTAEGVETRAVGGAVRNTLLGLNVTEIDLATTALPERVIALAAKAGLKAVPTGIDHGTVTVVAAGVPFEVTTLRRDVVTFGRHARTSPSPTTGRRTRAGATSPSTRSMPIATAACSIRSAAWPICLPPACASSAMREARIKEDYLRILRFFRFNAYYGKAPLDRAGLDAAVRLREGMAQLSAERVGAELRRIPDRPASGRRFAGAFVRFRC